jgi:hypothetical protein
LLQKHSASSVLKAANWFLTIKQTHNRNHG